MSIFGACDNHKNDTDEPLNNYYLFEDGFETQNNSINELFPLTGSRWTKTQQTNPSNTTNDIFISNSEFSEGQNTLRILAYQSDSQLSKMDIEKKWSKHKIWR